MGLTCREASSFWLVLFLITLFQVIHCRDLVFEIEPQNQIDFQAQPESIFKSADSQTSLNEVQTQRNPEKENWTKSITDTQIEKPSKIFDVKKQQDVLVKGIAKFIDQFKGKLAKYFQRRISEGPRLFTSWLGGGTGWGATGLGTTGWGAPAPAHSWISYMTWPMAMLTGGMFLLDYCMKWWFGSSSGGITGFEFSSPPGAGGYKRNAWEDAYDKYEIDNPIILDPIPLTSVDNTNSKSKPSQLTRKTRKDKGTTSAKKENKGQQQNHYELENNPYPYPGSYSKRILHTEEQPYKLKRIQ